MQGVNRILVGVDLHHGDRIATDDWGPSTQAALDEAVIVAGATGAEVTLCGVLEVSEHAHHLIAHDEKNLLRTVEDVARAALERLTQSLSERGVKAAFVIAYGQAWEELTREAIAGRHDLVLVGTRSRNLATRMLFGSTAQKLIRFCPKPVWIAKPGEVREIREILVATDFSQAAFVATQAAVSVAQAIPSKLFVVHALEFPMESYFRTAGVNEEDIQKYRTRMQDEAREHLQSHLGQTDFRTLTYGVKPEVLEGTPDSVIPQFVADNEVDLLVIGTQGRSGMSGVLLGNTAERILPFVHCSLLAIKPADFVSPLQ
jgi:universal stress protein E